MALATAMGCDRPKAKEDVAISSTTTPTATTTATTTPTATTTASALNAADGGASVCRLTYGPIQQPFTGEAVLVATDRGVDIVTHQKGEPTVTSLSAGPPNAKPARVAAEGGPPTALATSPPCAAAGANVYCMDASGAIGRTARMGGGGRAVVARARAGTRIAAATLAEVHTVVAFLVERTTSEGAATEAYAVADDAPPVRISEEGSGATFVTLARRGTEVIAMLVDARMALTAVHARVLSWASAHVVVGKDAVVFVGGTPERATRGVLATNAETTAASFALLPIAAEGGFGMSAIAIGETPRDDEPVSWSFYPNGLDPAPVAATFASAPIRVARVRPAEARPDSARVLELGQLDAAGVFSSLGFIPTNGRVTSVAVAAEARGALWLHYTDATGSWVERRACP